MIKKEFKFSDGTRIFCEEVNGITQRFIEYAYNPYQREQLIKETELEKWYKRQQRRFLADKYYYLEVLWSTACVMDKSQRHKLYNELKELNDKVGTEYDENIINKDFLHTFGKYWKGEEIICAAFFTTIYLDMLDHEVEKKSNPYSLGKTKVLKSCKAVILGGMRAQDAASIMDFYNIIDKAIRTEGVIEMEYSKDESSDKYYQLYNVGYSAEFGEMCFHGCPIGSEYELNFRMDRVKDMKLMWDFVFEENIRFDKSGIYALSFMGDNYLDFGLYSYDRGEMLLDHYQFGLWAIQAYHYIPYYSETNKNQWHFFDKSEVVKENSIYVFAYTMEPGISVDLNVRFDFLLTGEYFKTTDHSGIHYTAIRARKGESFSKIEINEGIKILAFSRCGEYSYENLGVHNDMRLEMKP